MERRSTNNLGFVHHQGDITAQVGSSHGVRLSGGSTGGILEAVGDDTNVTLTIRGQGASTVVIGSTNQGVRLNSTTVVIGSVSTTALAGIQRYTVEFTPAALSSGPAQSESTLTVSGLTTNAALLWTVPTALSVNYGYGVRCSTAAELKLNQFNLAESSIGTGQSTNRGLLIELRF
jgi:hypothetical protein